MEKDKLPKDEELSAEDLDQVSGGMNKPELINPTSSAMIEASKINTINTTIVNK
jgi:hypothetical protein